MMAKVIGIGKSDTHYLGKRFNGKKKRKVLYPFILSFKSFHSGDDAPFSVFLENKRIVYCAAYVTAAQNGTIKESKTEIPGRLVKKLKNIKTPLRYVYLKILRKTHIIVINQMSHHLYLSIKPIIFFKLLFRNLKDNNIALLNVEVLSVERLSNLFSNC